MKKRKPDPTQEGLLALAESRFAVDSARQEDPRWNCRKGESWANALRSIIEEVEDEPAKCGPTMKAAVLLAIEDYNAAHEIRRGHEIGDEGKMVFHCRYILRCRERMKTPYRAVPAFSPTFDLPSAALSDDDIIKVCEEWADAQIREDMERGSA